MLQWIDSLCPCEMSVGADDAVRILLPVHSWSDRWLTRAEGHSIGRRWNRCNDWVGGWIDGRMDGQANRQMEDLVNGWLCWLSWRAGEKTERLTYRRRLANEWVCMFTAHSLYHVTSGEEEPGVLRLEWPNEHTRLMHGVDCPPCLCICLSHCSCDCHWCRCLTIHFLHSMVVRLYTLLYDDNT